MSKIFCLSFSSSVITDNKSVVSRHHVETRPYRLSHVYSDMQILVRKSRILIMSVIFGHDTYNMLHNGANS